MEEAIQTIWWQVLSKLNGTVLTEKLYPTPISVSPKEMMIGNVSAEYSCHAIGKYMCQSCLILPVKGQERHGEHGEDD